VPRLPCALRFSYDGSAFRGWQRQPGMATVQEEIERALQSCLSKKVIVFGAARTDAGVHAEGQICHFVKESVDTEAAVDSLFFDLRAKLPEQIRLSGAALAHPSFHARSSAIGKRYRYKFSWGAKIDPEDKQSFQLGLEATPDWDRARRALDGLRDLGELPGLSSPSTDRRPAPPLASFTITEEKNGCALELAGPAFRKHQVRNMAGHLAAVALNLAEPDTLATLAKRTRPWMGACAPPHGLTLLSVTYPRDLDPFLEGPR
jgi:tRNA pseudouridine38-40 synthase